MTAGVYYLHISVICLKFKLLILFNASMLIGLTELIECIQCITIFCLLGLQCFPRKTVLNGLKEKKSATINIFGKNYFLFKSFVKAELS